MKIVNQYLKDFRSQLRMKFAEDSESMLYSDWIIRNTKLRKKPYSFAGFEFQKQIVDDMHPDLSVIKCSQIGLTEINLRKFAAFLARNTAVNGIFTLPDDTMYKRVSQTRFGPMVNTEHVFNLGGEKPVRSMSVYQINQSYGYFTGNKEGDATSINADILMHDELDLSNQEMIGLFQSRLQGSQWRITHKFSTPTFEGFGIDANYRVSDQHEYMVKCQSCNHHNIPEFNTNFVTIPGLSSDINDLTEIDNEMADKLDLKAAYIRCEKCGNKLDFSDADTCQWVPRFPGRRKRGYRVNPFSCRPHFLTVDYIIDQMLQYKQKDALRRFYNTVLGLPFNDSNARLNEVDIRACMKSPLKATLGPSEPVFIGIDVGITCHIVLLSMGQRRPVVFDFRQVLADNLIDEVQSLLETYNIVGGCMDRNPYTPLANDVRDLSQGRIMPVEYAHENAAAVQLVKDELDSLSHIRGNRTTMIDAVAQAIRKRRIELAGYGSFESLLILHLRDMVRIEKEDTSATWQKLQGNDHFFHALAYAMFAIRTTDAIIFRTEQEERTAVDVLGITMAVNSGATMGMTSRRKETISLGTFT